MRSVNITYKKSRRDSTGQLLGRNYSTPKRCVDDYYQRLLEKQQNRQKLLNHKREVLERHKLRTASQHQLKDPFHIIQTLNIAPLALREQSTPAADERRQQNKSQLRMLISRKMSSGQPTLFGLNPTPQLQSYQQDQQNAMRWPCNKLKCLYKQKSAENKGTVLALSVNFIVNEHSCWQSQQIEQMAAKHWKMLQNYSNIAWICEKEETAKKLLRFSKSNVLRLDAVYCIVPKKNRRLLTVNYTSVQTDFCIKNGSKVSTPLLTKEQRKLVVIQGLLIQNYDKLTYTSFFNAIPLIKNGRSVIHYTKIDPSDSNRFGSVVKILSQSSQPRPYYIMRVLRQFQQHQQSSGKEVDCNCSMKDYKPQERNPLSELQQMKMRLIKFFERSMSMKMSGRMEERANSIQFMIGDAIRRNYKIYQNILDFQSECQFHNHHQKIHLQHSGSPLSPRRLMMPQKYGNLVYLWRL